MVNYCCVTGCGRNSRSSQNLFYYSVPKEISRQEQWLNAAGRQDLLNKPAEKRILYRFCSRHFSASSFKNKHLCADAVPTQCLPGSEIEVVEDSNDERLVHQNIACDNCGNTVSGFRYKCITCSDYDLCSRCEMNEAHSQHYMMRIPAPNKAMGVELIIKKFQELYKNSDLNEDESSDDEPVTKYVTNKDNSRTNNDDSGVDLPEDVKEIIRKEVDRLFENRPIKKRRLFLKSDNNKSKKPHKEATDKQTSVNAPEVVFADCNAEVNVEREMCIKIEPLPSFEVSLQYEEQNISMGQMKLSDDLSELMMEVQNTAQSISSVEIIE